MYSPFLRHTTPREKSSNLSFTISSTCTKSTGRNVHACCLNYRNGFNRELSRRRLRMRTMLSLEGIGFWRTWSLRYVDRSFVEDDLRTDFSTSPSHFSLLYLPFQLLPFLHPTTTDSSANYVESHLQPSPPLLGNA